MLLPVAGRAIIDYTLEAFGQTGVTDVALNVVLGSTSSTTGAGSWDTDGASGVGGAGYDSDWIETYLGTDADQPCSLTKDVFDETEIDAWIFDTNGSGSATLGDVLGIAPVFLQLVTTPEHARYDWNVDGFVSLSDVLSIAPVFLEKCEPVVLPQ